MRTVHDRIRVLNGNQIDTKRYTGELIQPAKKDWTLKSPITKSIDCDLGRGPSVSSVIGTPVRIAKISNRSGAHEVAQTETVSSAT